MQCERIRKLISRWHRDELGAERKAARRKCSKALAPILDIIRKNRVHASLQAVHASLQAVDLHGNAPHDTAHPPSLSHLEASRAVLGLAVAARGATRRADAAGWGACACLTYLLTCKHASNILFAST
jgi:hypothetical protein